MPVLDKSSWERVKQLFDAAIELPPDGRSSFLDVACADDTRLRNEVASLLAAHDSNDDPSRSPTIGAQEIGVACALPDHPVGTHIGPYKLLEKIGEGGFGTVYMAEQREPVQRRVALKVVKPGMDSKQVIARFEAERQALAMMDHPNIARVLEAGATDAQSSLGPGRPYFVMELVRGIPITKFCDEKNLSIRQRLELAIDVCHAVQHAHMKGVIHRDLKPSNVLVTMHDDKTVPKVIDFGIAKATQGRLTEKTLFTEFRQLIGTPAYMSPEQAQMSGIDVDTRSDIYSLGVLLYELLTGTTPFDAKTLLDSGYDEMRRIIREVEPPRPSTRLSSFSAKGTKARKHEGTKGDDSGAASLPGAGSSDSSSADVIAGLRHTDAPTLRRQLCGDLDWIVMKCLEKDRARRYETANGLAADLAHHLAGEPVVAAPPGRLYRLRKLARQHRGTLAAISVIALLLAGGTTVSSVFWLRAERESAAAREEAHKATLVADFLANMLGSIDPDRVEANDSTLRWLLDAAVGRIKNGELAAAPAAEIHVRLEIGRAYRLIGAHQAAEETLRAALELACATYGSVHREVARALHALGHSLADSRRHGASLETHEAALEILDRLNVGDDTDRAENLKDLAECLDALGRPAEGLPRAEKALAIAERLHDDPLIAMTLATLARCLNSLGRPGEALTNYEQALTMQLALHPEDQSDVATAYNDLGRCLWALGRFEDALTAYQRALAMRQRIVTGDHPRLVTNLSNVASCLQSLSRYDEALPLFEQALTMARRLYPEDHAAVALQLQWIADARRAAGDWVGAEAPALQAVAMYRSHTDWNSKEYVRALSVLANLYEAEERAADAVVLLREIVDLGTTGREPASDTELGMVLSRLGPLLRCMGLHQEAEARLREGLALARRVYGDGDYRTAYFLSHLAGTVRERGRLEEAEKLARQAIDIYRSLGAEHLDHYCAVEDDLGETLVAQGKLDAWDAVRLEFLDDCRAKLPPGHPEVTRQLGVLALSLLERGKHAAAEPIIREVLAIREQTLQPGSPDFWLLAQSRSMLGETLVGQAALAASEPGVSTNTRLATPVLGTAIDRLREAEPLIIDSSDWLSANFERINPEVPLQLRQDRVRQAAQRVVSLYETWQALEPDKGYEAKAAEARRNLEMHMRSQFATTGPAP